jgi:myo-inositol-1(or 4)-monophosphatase
VATSTFVPFLDTVLNDGGMFIRNGSGALMIAYVAAGRLIGYFEPHINSWDCLAGIVLVVEAGGISNAFLANNGLEKGNPILVAGPAVYDLLAPLALPFC